MTRARCGPEATRAPAGLTELLSQLAGRYGAALPPLYITENGCSSHDEVAAGGTVDDQFRIGYLDGHIRAVHAAMSAGVDVRGYFCWTLADNFEWSEDYCQRSGWSMSITRRRCARQGVLRLVPRPDRRAAGILTTAARQGPFRPGPSWSGCPG